jgi:hypothetical protein
MKIIDPEDFYKKEGRNLLAIDIGKKGGAVWNEKGKLFSMSMTNEAEEIATLLRNIKVSTIVAENVHAWGGQGVVSSGTLMQERGRWEGAVAAFGKAPIKFIEPRAWVECFTYKKRDNFTNTDRWKKHLIEIANANCRWLALTSSGISDAWMIWNYYASIIVDDRMRPIGEFQFG